MRNAILALFLLLTPLAVTSCASSVPPTITRQPTVPFDRNVALQVHARRQRERIVASLHAAGLKTSDTRDASGYTLVVSVGSARAIRECGSVHNVAYVLRVDRQRLVIKGRGETGDCAGNIFDAMSQKLAASMAD